MHFIVLSYDNSASSTILYAIVNNPKLMYWFALGN